MNGNWFKLKLLITGCFLFGTSHLFAQEGRIHGRVLNEDTGKPVAGAEVFIQNSNNKTTTNKKGYYQLSAIEPGVHEVATYYPGLQSKIKKITIGSEKQKVNFKIAPFSETLENVTIEERSEDGWAGNRLRSVEGMGIYESKKNEVIKITELNANLATNNAREIYAKVPGLNIWENGNAGLQLAIGARGLDPSRTSNFNVRQNGYDISADALGYPDSYYTPPAEAIEEIQIVRGAASLQYGPQFGGLINFILKKPPENDPFQLVSRQTIGSFGLFNSFNSIGGTKGDFSYNTWFHHKIGEGWRENSRFNSNTYFGSVSYHPGDHFTIDLEYTHMNYLAQQPGGLTDALFYDNPRQSIRDRNWFRVNWNLAAVKLDYEFSPRTRLNMRNFGLLGQRDALGNLQRIDRVDFGGPRNLIKDDYRNWGNESRIIHNYQIKGQPATFLGGFRYYQGATTKKQGNGNARNTGEQEDFKFLNPDRLEGSDYDFPSKNLALFAENIFPITSRLTITPGIRFENIQTFAEGYYHKTNKDFAGNILLDTLIYEDRSNKRSFTLFGLGASYHLNGHTEFYSNFSKNYRGITFNNLRINNPNFRIDSLLEDERGFNFDIGARGELFNWLTYDVSLFYLQYDNRIGSILKIDTTDIIGQIYRYRTNVADSRHIGLEGFFEAHLLRTTAGNEKQKQLSLFTNISFTDARYINSDEPAIKNKMVELVPRVSLKTGLNYQKGDFEASFQYAFTGKHYTDATNAEKVPTAVNGIIPAYGVTDFSAEYAYKFFKLEAGINNMTNNMYFTRRASGYPGPGIIPAEGRNFYATLQIKL